MTVEPLLEVSELRLSFRTELGPARVLDAVNLTVVVGLDDLYLTGGRGPDTIEPGAQQYDYRVTNYDPRTGAESNGSPIQEAPRTDTSVYESAPIDTIRRAIIVDPPAYGDAAIRPTRSELSSAAVNTASTPGATRASSTSSRTIRPRAISLRANATWATFGTTTSST